MIDLVKYNAFGILGLLPDASQKEISKKGKELSKLLKFGDKLEYPLDFDFYCLHRNETFITDAVNNLTSIKTHILHSFFRVSPVSEKEKQAIIALSEFNSMAAKVSTLFIDPLIKDRNKLIILLIYLYGAKTKKLTNQIMQFVEVLLDKFIQKDAFIKDFKKIYKLTDELGIDDKIFKTLKTDIAFSLVQTFSNIAEEKKDNSILYSGLKYLAPFIENYKEIPSINRILEDISDVIKYINNTSAEDLEKNKSKFRDNLKKGQDLFNECIEMNIYDSLFFLSYRDAFCKALSAISVSYFNKTRDVNIALGLIKVAQDIGGTTSIDKHLQESVNTLKEIKKEDNEPITDLYLKKDKLYPMFSFYRNRVLVYTKKFFSGIQCQEILYQNIEGYSFYVLKHATNGVPDSTTRDLKILVNNGYYDQTYTYSCTSNGWDFNEENTDFYAILDILEKVSKSKIIERILHQIFSLNETYSIGSISFDRNGITSRGIFFNKTLLWKDIKYKAKFASGEVIIYNENGKIFEHVQLSEINAPVIPDLILRVISSL